MLTMRQISSRDAKAASKYFMDLVEHEREASSARGSYYANEQALGGRAVGHPDALAALGINFDRLTPEHLERLLRGYSATPADPRTEPDRFDVDFVRLAALCRSTPAEVLSKRQARARAAVLHAAAAERAPSARRAGDLAARCVSSGLLDRDEIPVSERTVRVPGMALDQTALRSAIEDLAGRDDLSSEARDCVDELLEVGVGKGVTADAIVKRLARPLEAAGLLDLGSFHRPQINSQDLTFGVPKTVSVAWAAGDDATRLAIETAVHQSAELALSYMVQSVPCVQRKTSDGRVEMETGAGVAASAFMHYTSRGHVGGNEAGPDPHLHVHMLVHGVLRQDVDGTKLVAPNRRHWVKHGREGGSYFRNELAHRMRELGFEIERGTGRDGRYFELAGVPKSLVERFSTRARGIERALAEYEAIALGPASDAVREQLVLRSRMRKSETAVELDDLWRDTCRSEGFTAQVVDKLRSHTLKRRRRDVLDVERRIVQRIEQVGAVASDINTRAIALEESAGVLDTAQTMRLLDAMQERAQLLALEDGRVTTIGVRDAERDVLDHAERRCAPLRDKAIARGIAQQDAELARRLGVPAGTVGMSAEQRGAVTRCLSDEAVTVVVGLPGTGKGEVLGAISHALRGSDRGILIAATQGARAQGAGAQGGVAARTLASFLKAAEHDNVWVHTADGRRRAERGDALVIDEAAMVDVFTLRAALDQAARLDLRVVLIGDPKQLDAIGPGGALGALAERTDAPELTEIHRARHEYQREYQNATRAGDGVTAIRLLEEHGALHITARQADAADAMLAAWDRSRIELGDASRSTMIVHSTNTVVDQVNVRAQQLRLAAGELGGASVRAPDRNYQLYVGDQVMFRTRAYEPKRGPRVENGTRGEVVAVHPRRGRLTVRVHEPGRDPRDVVVHTRDCEALRLAYATHVYPAQGDTFERTFELSGGLHTTHSAFYVSSSRARDRHEVFTSREALEAGTDRDARELLAERIVSRPNAGATLNVAIADRRIALDPAATITDARQRELDYASRSLTRARTHRLELEHSIARWREQDANLQRARSAIDDAARRHEQAVRDRIEAQERRALLPEARRQRDAALRDADARIARAEQELEQAREALSARLAQRQDRGLLELDAVSRLDAARAREATARERHAQALERLSDAARREPPLYVREALGAPPRERVDGSPADRAEWDHALRELLAYRSRHRIRDPHRALGNDERRPSYEQERMQALLANARTEPVRAKERGAERAPSSERALSRDPR